MNKQIVFTQICELEVFNAIQVFKKGDKLNVYAVEGHQIYLNEFESIYVDASYFKVL